MVMWSTSLFSLDSLASYFGLIPFHFVHTALCTYTQQVLNKCLWTQMNFSTASK